MSNQDVPGRLCQEAYQHILKEEPSLAAAFYMAAFSCNAPTAIQRAKALAGGQFQQVIATLESWCFGESEIPKIRCDGMAIVSLTPGIAAVFLSTLCPNNFAASLFKMSTFLKSGRYEDVVNRCNSLLNTHPQYRLEILLTRALALVLSQTNTQNGVQDYIQAFTKHKDKTQEFIRTKQREYLPHLINSFNNYICVYQNDTNNGCTDSMLQDCYNFLSALAPDDVQICKTQAAYLFEKCKFEECIAVYSRAIETLSLETRIKEEKISCLLVDRAAAYYSLGCRTKEMVQDLSEAFKVSLSHARKRFHDIFSADDVARVIERSKSYIEMEFGDYRETVRTRTELRSDTGAELLFPIVQTLEFLIQCCPSNRREMNVRLADCKLLSGDFRACLDICNHLLDSEKKTYQNTLLVLRGFCHFHNNEHQEALKDFQRIVEDESPHPSSCVKALCGRGLIRMISGSPYLTALDYITACKLKLDETLLTIKSYVPWNQRGLLYKVLQEEGQKMLHRKSPNPNDNENKKKQNKQDGPSSKECDVSGVHQLATLLMMLDPSDDVCRILCTDALYQLDRIDEAHKMLSLALNSSTQRSPVLARLALLQFKKGFIYDGNQLIKKVIQIGDTSCLLPIMDVFKEEDRKLMQDHCHSKALSVLQNREGETYIKEAIAYFSFAIIASGGHAKDSLLARARCYGQLGQKKTAIFDFNAVLKDDPRDVEALSGKAFMHMSLRQQKEAVHDLCLAVKVDTSYVIREAQTLKPEAQLLVTEWLHDHCRTSLAELLTVNAELLSDPAFGDLEKISQCLTEIDNTNANVHILYTDILIGKEKYEEAFMHLKKSFSNSAIDESAKARYGVLHVKYRNVLAAAQELCPLAGKSPSDVEILVKFLDKRQRQSLSQVAGQEGNSLSQENQHGKALNYFSLAVIASNNNPKYLRQRASCLSHLGDYKSALIDMDKAIQRHGSNDLQVQVEDYCSKGYVLLLISEEDTAVRQYMKALSLDNTFALACISNTPGKCKLSQIFTQIAHKYFEQRSFEESWKITDCGLLIDENNHELKRLKARIKREASGCIVH
ncbi:tetratricopeptide repeat protein 34 [Spea bombifrons]|uniref:tetratricopeptide repeat protein 34 n=1 Tax=Spea bombifrons TaxID=233779 RepID=UPI00234A6C70|nr:tetratricopeptide repeat protein 34 [Spea bombifrons]